MSAEQVGGKPVPFLIPAIFNRSKLMSSLWFYPGLQEHLPNSCQMCSAPRGSSMRLSCGFLPETSQGYTAEVSNMAKLKGPAASPSQQKNPKDPLHPGTRSLGAAFPPKTMTAFSLEFPQNAQARRGLPITHMRRLCGQKGYEPIHHHSSQYMFRPTLA